MSNTIEYLTHPHDAAIALFLQEDNADKLTDILVDALDEAFRILNEELVCGPLN
jgi:phosphorylcholine metabolism protein LicD